MSAFNIWSENPPPRDAIVMARWKLTGSEHDTRWFAVRTCKQGCCVFDYPPTGLGAMALPKYWREPTEEESRK